MSSGINPTPPPLITKEFYSNIMGNLSDNEDRVPSRATTSFSEALEYLKNGFDIYLSAQGRQVLGFSSLPQVLNQIRNDMKNHSITVTINNQQCQSFNELLSHIILPKSNALWSGSDEFIRALQDESSDFREKLFPFLCTLQLGVSYLCVFMSNRKYWKFPIVIEIPRSTPPPHTRINATYDPKSSEWKTVVTQELNIINLENSLVNGPITVIAEINKTNSTFTWQRPVVPAEEEPRSPQIQIR
jgi:hypothetical protein